MITAELVLKYNSMRTMEIHAALLSKTMIYNCLQTDFPGIDRIKTKILH